MSSPDPEKAKPGSVSLYPRQWAYLKAKKEGASSYLQGLIEAEMSAIGTRLENVDAEDPDCFVKLCRNICPVVTPELRKRLKGVHQPRALQMLIIQYAQGMLGLRDEWQSGGYPAMAAEDGAAYPAKDGE